MTSTDKLIARYREVQEILGGCHDGYCVIKKPKGMHTNGGCQCLQDLDFMGRQYVGHLLRIAQEMTDALSAQQKRIDEVTELANQAKSDCEALLPISACNLAGDILRALQANTGKGE